MNKLKQFIEGSGERFDEKFVNPIRSRNFKVDKILCFSEGQEVKFFIASERNKLLRLIMKEIDDRESEETQNYHVVHCNEVLSDLSTFIKSLIK
jgi:hypothetical protein